MTLEELDAIILERPAPSDDTTLLPADLPDDSGFELATALSLLSQVGDMLEELIELKDRKPIPKDLKLDIAMAATEIELFLTRKAETDADGEEWER